MESSDIIRRIFGAGRGWNAHRLSVPSSADLPDPPETIDLDAAKAALEQVHNGSTLSSP